MILRKIIYIFSMLFFVIVEPQSAITYGLSGGRFGNNIFSVAKGLYYAQKYDLPFVYTPFEFSDQLELHNIALDQELFSFVETVKCSKEKDFDIDPNANILYTISYWTLPSEWGNDHLPLKYDEEYIEMLRALIKPKKPLNLVKIPSNKISVAVHIRRGGILETSLLSKERIPKKRVTKRNYIDFAFPGVFLPDYFYIEQIKKLSEYYHNKPMFVYVFTDDSNPEKLVEYYKSMIKKPNIKFGYRMKNSHNRNVLEDFFSMLQFDCLIRSDSTFAKAAQLLGNYKIIVYAEHAYWHNEYDRYSLKVDKVKMIKNYNS